MSDVNEIELKRRRSARFHLILIGVIAASPFVGSYLLYKLWKPDAFVNHGELVVDAQPPAPSSADPLQATLKSLEGKWVLATVDSGACGETCRNKLYYLRQIRLTQGKSMDRIERLWMVSDGVAPDATMMKEFTGMQVVMASSSEWVRKLPSRTTPGDYIYIIDPLGNVVLRYPPGFNPTGMKKDLSRLIRASRIG